MKFRLHYRGPLHSNASIDRLQQIRRAIHPQLATLWNSPTLAFRKTEDWVHPTKRATWFRDRGPFQFVPLINQQLYSIAALHITLLRPGELGSVLTRAGDIDNRLKTLFDALRVPDIGQIPRDDVPQKGETPFFCLLDDDALVTEVDVVTDRLLEPTDNENLVELIIAVSIRSSRETVGAVQWTL
jgi:hypothetical protein